jgi:hypothetical protein
MIRVPDIRDVISVPIIHENLEHIILSSPFTKVIAFSSSYGPSVTQVSHFKLCVLSLLPVAANFSSVWQLNIAAPFAEVNPPTLKISCIQLL